MNKYDHNTKHPNLIILGSQKSGTTSLFRYLSEHPDVFGSNPIKEAGFFSKIGSRKRYFSKRGVYFDNKNQLLNRFILKGYNNQKYILDASTVYTIGKNSNKLEVIDNLKKYDTSLINFIYIVRNPVERIVSSFFHIYKDNIAKEPDKIIDFFENFMCSEQWSQSLLTTLYYKQISTFINNFTIEKFHILTLDELKNDPALCLNNIFKFLKIHPLDISKENLKPSNEATIKKEHKKIVRNLLLKHRNFIISKGIIKSDIIALSKLIDIDQSWLTPLK